MHWTGEVTGGNGMRGWIWRDLPRAVELVQLGRGGGRCGNGNK